MPAGDATAGLARRGARPRDRRPAAAALDEAPSRPRLQASFRYVRLLGPRYEERSPAERGGLEAPLAEEGIRLLRELPRTGDDALLLHTDLHAGNVLAAEREPWLAIDPKPYVGDPAYDVTQHIFNGVFIEGADAGVLAARMAHLLDLDLSRIQLWLFARAVEASPYWTGMADLARTLRSFLT